MSGVSFSLPVNKATLVFFPSDNSTEPPGASSLTDPYVVQVRIRLARTTLLDEIAYSEVQSEVSRAIQTLLLAHILSPFSSGDRLPGCEHLSDGDVVIEGKGYKLNGSFQPWEFGQNLVLKWGTHLVKPCRDKWNFTFKRLI